MAHTLPKALILSSDRKTVAVFRSMLRAFDVEAESPRSVGETLLLLARNKLDAVVIDCDDRDARDVIEALRKGRSNRCAVVVALVSDRAAAREAYAMGANMTLEKPVTIEAIQRSLRAVHGMILRERRRYLRVNLAESLVIVLREHGLNALLVNVSSGGLRASVHQGRGLRLHGPVRVRFGLPHSPHWIQAEGHIAWSDGDGGIGVQFTNIHPQTQAQLEKWIGQQGDAVPANPAVRARPFQFTATPRPV